MYEKIRRHLRRWLTSRAQVPTSRSLIPLGPHCSWDPEGCRIWRDGHPVNVPPIAQALLQYLIEHPNRVVPDAELIQAGWHGDVRGPADLYKHIHRLRQIIEDDPHQPNILLTRNRLGYFLNLSPKGPASED